MGKAFTENVNFAGVTPLNPARIDVATGAYTVKILDCEEATGRVGEDGSGGKLSIRYQCMITEDGASKGLPLLIVIGTDWSKEGNKKHLFNCLVGTGVPPEALNGPKTIGNAHFVGKSAYVWVQAPPEGERDDQGRKPFGNKNFITREQYQQLKAMTAAQGGAGSTAGAAAQAAPQNGMHPGATPASDAPLSDLFPT